MREGLGTRLGIEAFSSLVTNDNIGACQQTLAVTMFTMYSLSHCCTYSCCLVISLADGSMHSVPTERKAIITGHNGYYKRVQRTASCVSSGVISKTSTLYLYLAMKYAPEIYSSVWLIGCMSYHIWVSGGEPEKSSHKRQLSAPLPPPPPPISLANNISEWCHDSCLVHS